MGWLFFHDLQIKTRIFRMSKDNIGTYM